MLLSDCRCQTRTRLRALSVRSIPSRTSPLYSCFSWSEKIVRICNARNSRPISRQRKETKAIVAGPGPERIGRAGLQARCRSRMGVDISLAFGDMLSVAYAMKKRTHTGEPVAIGLDARHWTVV